MGDYFYYIGEIRAFPYRNLLIDGWLYCDGSIVSVSNYQALYAVIGRTFTPSGVSNSQFALPNINGRVPISSGQAPNASNYTFGNSNGQETQLPTINNMGHSHTLTSNVSGDLFVDNIKGNSGDLANAKALASQVQVTKTTVNSSLSTTSTDTLKGIAVNIPSCQVVPRATNSTGVMPVDTISIMEPFLTMHYYICALDGFYPLRD